LQQKPQGETTDRQRKEKTVTELPLDVMSILADEVVSVEDWRTELVDGNVD
jgi:hypothetical protein